MLITLKCSWSATAWVLKGLEETFLAEIARGLHELYYKTRTGITTWSKVGNCVYWPTYSCNGIYCYTISVNSYSCINSYSGVASILHHQCTYTKAVIFNTHIMVLLGVHLLWYWFTKQDCLIPMYTYIPFHVVIWKPSSHSLPTSSGILQISSQWGQHICSSCYI